ncbi:hypothetical protein P691DRAFT_671935 [Macrolepiota fuliginosa MF-IS2]|uniref:Uncharacterized protein n=1 Tax=Macrolepiota fuliginosa MF-IS2 TaxID=1400762 RepID=A0A9P6C381_9AGAR|nr:hypothetical protein P691DRAFT_671935 [Macrolepiota fuliginosa MF-IS2]
MAANFPPAQAKSSLTEALDLIGSTTINGILCGMAFALYCLCAWSLYPQLRVPDQRKQAALTLIYTSLVILCELAIVALTTSVIRLVYIDHDPGGLLNHEKVVPGGQRIAFFSTSSVALDFLTFGVQMQRLWVIWVATQYATIVILLPFLLYISFIDTILTIWPHYPDILSLKSGTALTIATLGVESAFTLLVTGLVITRLVIVRRRHMSTGLGSSMTREYVCIAAMLIESYALESAWSFIAMVLYAVGSPWSVLFIQCDDSIKVIAYLLVVYRVSKGRAWNNQTENQLSDLRWNHGTQTATVETMA